MVKTNDEKLVCEINKLNENETVAVIGYISELLSARMPKPKKNPINDELIISLADAKENKRARQVVEWERVRVKSLQKSI